MELGGLSALPKPKTLILDPSLSRPHIHNVGFFLCLLERAEE